MDFLGTQTCKHIVGDPPTAFTLYTCPRCLGQGVYGSLGFDSRGKVNVISKTTQLKQTIKKLLTEDMRTSGYGFDYSLLREGINLSTLSAVRMEVSRCISYLIDSQSAAEGRGVQYDPAERVVGVSNITVIQAPEEPRKVVVSLTVTTQLNNVQVTTPIAR